MNRTLLRISAGALLVVLTACTQGAPTGATLPPLTTGAVASSEASTPASTTPETTSEPDVTSTTQVPPADVTVPAEASALPLPTAQVDLPADNAQEEADRAAIEAVWRQVWDLYRDGYEMSESEIRDTAAEILADPLKTQLVDGLLLPQSRVAEANGSVITHPYWYRPVDGSSYAVMGDCLDYSGMTVSDKGTGTNMTRGTADVDSVGHFIRGADGRWRVWQLTTVTGSSCTA